MSIPSNPKWRSRALILLIALMSVVPFTLAWYYARHPELITRRTNYGTLILPARPLDYATLFAKPLSPPDALAELKGRWILLHVASGECGPACTDTLYKTHQVRLMLNKEIPRVRRLLLVPEESPPDRYAPLLKGDDSLGLAAASPALRQALATAVGKPPAETMVLLLDPLGNLMMWYDTGFDPYGLVKDLKHLLKASQIG
jgi:hypothetical protein